jgi:4-hydroxybenzoate polyprenyltransferase
MSWELAGGNMFAAIAPVFFWLAYYGFRRPGNTGLRAWLLAKPFTIALVWTWVTVLLPVSLKFWGTTQLMFLERYAFIFTLAFAYDVSDLGYDRRAGFSTLASKMTLKSNFSLIFIGLGLSGLCVGLSFAKGYYGSFSVIPLFISLIFSAWWIFFLLQQAAWQAWHKVLIDGLMPLQCALVLLLRFVLMK